MNSIVKNVNEDSNWKISMTLHWDGNEMDFISSADTAYKLL
jgi:hypothetical protein